MVLRGQLRAREQTESDDDDDQHVPVYRPPPRRKLLRLRCYVCAGTGRLEILDGGPKDGRLVRCIACGGTGRVTVE
jgi:hypothetical protein